MVMRDLHLDDEAQTVQFLITVQRAGELPPPCLLVLVADDLGRLVLPIAIDEIPADPPQDERIEVLSAMLEHVVALDGLHGVALAVSRAGHPQPRGSDFGWHDAHTQCCRAARVTCHGTYVATPYGVRRVRPGPAPDLLAA